MAYVARLLSARSIGKFGPRAAAGWRGSFAALSPLSSAPCRTASETPLSPTAAAAAAAETGESGGVPQHARVVVVGGGIIGASVAYHLGHAGWGADTVLLERDSLTSGTTWHAAGLCVTFGSMSETMVEIRKYSRALYKQLEEETGQDPGFYPIGFVELATSPERLEEFRRVAAFNRFHGVDVDEISAAELKKLQPMVRTDDVLAGFYTKEDGRINPVDVTMALAKGARMKGVKVCKGVTVTGVTKEKGRVTGVETNKGHIHCDVVVNCAGMWARQLGQMSGITIPNQAAEHYYVLTGPMEGVDKDWPIVEDPSCYTYLRPEGDGMMVGLFEPEAAAWSVDQVPQDFSFADIPPDWERMTPFIEKALSRIPATLDAGIRQLFCGPESFTPDLAPIVGESLELKNYFVCAGLNSIGILAAGGFGRLMTQWITTGRPDQDVTGFNADRLHPYQNNPDYRRDRVAESLGMVYKPHYPSYSLKTARGVKKSAIFHRLEEKGAYFRDVSGWESPDWYAPPGVKPVAEPLTWGRHHWFPYWEKEHHACRNGVILMDMSFMAKYLVAGRDAGKFLNYLSTANVDGPAGEIHYTQWLAEDGTMEADVTVAKLDEDRFQVVVTDTMHRHALYWMNKHLPPNSHVFINDITGSYAQINIQGPRSRELLALITDTDVSNEAFPFRSVQEIAVGYARATCVRITYLGELGYELYVPSEHAVHVYDHIVEAGEQVGLVHAGLKALSSLRMEKAYRDYGHDMDNTDTLLEVGLGFTADYEKEGGFRGKEVILAQKEKKLVNLPKRLVQVLLKDPQPLMYHGEVVYRDGVPVGDIRAASYGHTLGGAVGLSMVKNPTGGTLGKKFIEGGKWEVDVAGTRYPAVASLQPMYDPKNERIRA